MWEHKPLLDSKDIFQAEGKWSQRENLRQKEEWRTKKTSNSVGESR